MLMTEIWVEMNTVTLSKQETNQWSIVVSIGIDIGFVRQLLKRNSKQYRSSITGRNGPGGI
jgi:hypothetical protein